MVVVVARDGGFAVQETVAAKRASGTGKSTTAASANGGDYFAVSEEGVELGVMGDGHGSQSQGLLGSGEVASPSARSLLAADKKEKHFRKVGKKVRLI